MTSWNYLLVVLYFTYGSILSCYAVFCNVDYYRSEKNGGASALRKIPPSNRRALTEAGTRSAITSNSKHECNAATANDDKSSNKNGSSGCDTISTKSSCGSTSELMDSMKNRGYSVDSILFDIEENSKRLSVAHSAKSHYDLHHARLHDNRLPSVSFEVFCQETFQELNLFLKIYWCISCVALNLTLITVTVYWAALFRDASNGSVLKWYLRIDRHGVVFLFVLLDYVIVRTPTRILHFIYPSMVMLIYGAVNGLYCRYTGRIVYSRLDFLRRPFMSTGLIMLGAFAAVPCFQFVIYWCLYRVKKKIMK